MPALVAFNRRWQIGSDDLVFPFTAGLMARFAWFIVVCSIYGVYHKDLKECHSQIALQTFFIGVIIVACLVMGNEVAIIWTSMQGTIMNTRPRQRIPILLYIQLALYVPEIALSILGIYWAFHSSTGCELGVVVPVQITVVLQWLILLSVFAAAAMFFDPLGALHKQDRSIEQSSKLWERRCRLLCCCFAGNDQQYMNAISQIAEMFASELHGVDAVPSDVAVGLILLQQQQEIESRGKPWYSGTPVDLSKDEERSRIDAAAYFMRYSVGSYGWPMYVFMNPCCGPCSLCQKARCSACCYPANSLAHIIKDNCCMCNTAAIHLQTELRNEDLFYCSYHNKLYEIPFYVALDRDKKTVVVSIRGTLSMKDTLTDLTGHGEDIHIEGLDGGMAHKGMYLSATYIKGQLIDHGILQEAFDEAAKTGESYRLVVVGHSLGAGTASVLSVLLKPMYPDLQCFAYSNPSCLNESACTRTEDYIMSVIVGKDVVPRMGVKNLNTLKRDLETVIMRCNQPKYRVLISGCWRALCFLLDKRSNGQTEGERQPLNSEGSASYVEEGLGSLAEREPGTSDVTNGKSLVQLYPAGKILQINELPQNRFDLLWANRQMFQRVLISHTMLKDHFPDVVLKDLTEIAKRA
ncbi:diacylglycerol lipase-beta isoform X2 [Nematostella vectensis]|uniref:diacylglycerol lipase-beta isoform X2 n=1 Tax=Nematostella vectensis TaxID=45351 RepID=UPI00138FA111|nr:diacylglycerol lipase-beta isoform X2 [Nematostella vectensis]